MGSKIIIVGDTHGWFTNLNEMIKHKSPEMVFICGDFGWWGPYHGTKGVVTGKNEVFNQYSLNPGNSKVFWCDGNHEHFWDIKLRLDQNGSTEFMPNVFYMPRGTVLTIPDGRNVLFFGGAESIDKENRKIGLDWFPEETVTQRDFFNLPDPNKVKIDIVISHTAPKKFNIPRIFTDYDKTDDPSCAALDNILDIYQPSLWYFGHWHHFQKGICQGCKWFGLGATIGPKSSTSMWFINLE